MFEYMNLLFGSIACFSDFWMWNGELSRSIVPNYHINGEIRDKVEKLKNIKHNCGKCCDHLRYWLDSTLS